MRDDAGSRDAVGSGPDEGLSPEDARALLATTIRELVPDADPLNLPPDADLRAEYALDSLDMVELVDRLSARARFRIEEEDTERLRTVASAVTLLVRGSAGRPR